ncbi:[NiFe] hydrogenase assembly HybE family chaperone [Ciceribacter lividus]|uniref:[NiFe] hydrogenase assembly HybE family chaperone n=1 Tax=Ciceribacter lividus TaxID=1197950 RepID=A0A6I7HM06_9HYPH|nr:[NiFe]-hydrogenase assembly chaperone HybE [Ciceribacter lividus]RCW24763.1 [NiFe] hydrogenase assembly HybE family chaperone [Ciceribacter lividus]
MEAEADRQTAEMQAAEIARRLEARYRVIAETAMADVPICNAALEVASCGFRPWGGRAFGVVVTPWFMNLLAVDLPGVESPPAANGTTVRAFLPAGEVELIAGELEGIGRVDACSLFSPVLEFSSMEVAIETAIEAANAFFDPEALAEPPPPAPAVNRRDLLRGRFGSREEAQP